MEFYMIIAIILLCWGFVLICLFNGRKIEKEIECKKQYVQIVAFVIMGILLYVKSHSLIVLAVTTLAGVVYSIIPTGYNDKGIYINGKEYNYKRIKNVEMNEESNCYRLTFTYRGKPHFISVKKEKRYILEDVIARYRRSTIL